MHLQQWKNLLFKEGQQGHEQINHQQHHPFRFSLKDSVVPRTGSLDVMQQIILSICNVSIAANNKISECTNSFTGKTSFIRPHISITVAGNARAWLFDTGAVSTCMPTRIFKDSFRNKPLPQKIHSTLNLKSVTGNALTQYGTFMLQMTIRGKIYSHPVNLDSLNNCIMGIAFMHKHKVSYDASKRQILLDQLFVQTSHATKQIIVPALSSKIIKTYFAGMPLLEANFVTTIAAPQHNTISGVHSWFQSTTTKFVRLSLTTVHHTTSQLIVTPF